MGEFLTPMLALILWTFVIWMVLYSRRLPAMKAAKINPQKYATNPNLASELPDRARWAANNYNHLHEQPVLFYALMAYLFMTGQTDTINLALAWAYVIIRVLHSLVQISKNIIMVRFSLFSLGSLVLLVIGVRAAIRLFA